MLESKGLLKKTSNKMSQDRCKELHKIDNASDFCLDNSG